MPDDPYRNPTADNPLPVHETLRIREAITSSLSEIEEELDGPFLLEDLPTGRVLVYHEGSREEGLVCYMSDRHPDARLILDDYVPEIGVDLAD